MTSRLSQPELGPTVPGPDSEPRPYRLSDAERSEAISALADAFAEGRLDAEEFEERMGAASQARLATELDPLFADLPRRAPAPRPSARVPAPVPTPAPRTITPDYGYPGPFVFVPLIVLVLMTTHLWFLLPLAFMALSVASRGFSHGAPRSCRGRAAHAARGGPGLSSCASRARGGPSRGAR